MDWNEKIEWIIDYVEEHLQGTQESIDQAEIEAIAQCSYGFFQKIFRYLYGISFAEYVRNRKMTLAGYDLKHKDERVIDVSLRYGYDSPTSFTKAFAMFHGVTPSVAKKEHQNLRVYPKMRIESHHERVHWHLEKKPAFSLIGLTTKVASEREAAFQEIPGFWSTCHQNGDFARLLTYDQAVRKGFMGICYDIDSRANTMTYMIAVTSDQESVPSGYASISYPAGTWAVFSCQGPVPYAIQEGWRFLYEEWYFRYPFSHTGLPDIEWYALGNTYSEQYQSEIWIPIVEED